MYKVTGTYFDEAEQAEHFEYQATDMEGCLSVCRSLTRLYGPVEATISENGRHITDWPQLTLVRS